MGLWDDIKDGFKNPTNWALGPASALLPDSIVGEDGLVGDIFDGGASERERAAAAEAEAIGQFTGNENRIPGVRRPGRKDNWLTGEDGGGGGFAGDIDPSIDYANIAPEDLALLTTGQRVAPGQRTVGANGKGERSGGSGVGQRAWDDPSFNTGSALSYIGDSLEGYDPSLAGVDGLSFMNGVEADPNSVSAQQTALDRVMGIADQGGLTAIDRARIEDARAGEEQWLRGQRGALMNNMQARGLGGSGAELAGMLSDQQASANRNRTSGVQMEALAQQRQDQALRDAFGMGSDMRGMSFDEQSRIADANDQTSRWNSQLTTDAARHRADTRNQGIFADNSTRNQGAFTDAATRNQATYYNANSDDRSLDATRGEAWNRYNADLGLRDRRSGIYQNTAAREYAEGQADQQAFRQTAGAVIGGLAGGPSGAQAGANMGGGGGGGGGYQYQPPAYQAPAYQAPPSTQYYPPNQNEILDPWEDD